jgi:hypothetical protein
MYRFKIIKIFYFTNILLEMKSVVVHFQGKAFDPSCLFAYQLADIGGGTTDKGN